MDPSRRTQARTAEPPGHADAPVEEVGRRRPPGSDAPVGEVGRRGVHRVGAPVRRVGRWAVQGVGAPLRRAGRVAGGPLRRFGRRTGQIVGGNRVTASLWSLAVLVRRKSSTDRILGMSAEAGFWGLVSLPSLLLAIFGAIGYFAGVLGPQDVRHIHDDVLRVARDVLSTSTVNSDVAPIVSEILSRGHAGVLSASFVISLWSGSSAMAAYVNTITVAYNMRNIRGVVRTRSLALGLYLLAVVALAGLLPAMILGPDAIVDLSPASAEHAVSTAVHLAYWPGLIVLSVAVVTTLYRLALPRAVRWTRQLPGAIFAVAIWLAGSIGLRAYVAHKVHSRTFYGALLAPVAALLFFYVTALAVLLGAEINAAMRDRRAAGIGFRRPHSHPPTDTVPADKRPAGPSDDADGPIHD